MARLTVDVTNFLNKITVTNFLNNELVDYASYDNMRKISSYIDGQKNTSRKILHTILKNNIKEEIKVAQLSMKMSEQCEYLHGDASSSVVTMAQNYAGTNNLPLIAREGNFGTRFKPKASAPRYIYTMKEKYTDDIFKKVDNEILIEQVFEGTVIEPRFFVPNLPILVINGSNGVSTGYTQNILPRNLDEVKNYLKDRLQGKDVSGYKLAPHFNGFNGVIRQGSEFNKWDIIGKITKVSSTTIRITEIPVHYDLVSYKKVLEDLIEKKIIRDYKDNCDGDKFQYDLIVPSTFMQLTEEKMIDTLKLVKRVSETYNCIDENNKIRVFNNIFEIIDAYIEIKKEYVKYRKEYQLTKLKEDMLLEASKFLFIKNVNDDVIIINKKTKQEIIDQIIEPKIIKKDGSYDYLLSMPLYKITLEEMDKSRNIIMEKKEEYKVLQETDIEDIWLGEL